MTVKEFKPFPELLIDATDHDGHVIVTKGKNGPSIIMDASLEDAQRLVDCWNACRKLYSPAAHIVATDEYVERLERLRKEAWARVTAEAPATEQAA